MVQLKDLTLLDLVIGNIIYTILGNRTRGKIHNIIEPLLADELKILASLISNFMSVARASSGICVRIIYVSNVE